MRCTPLKAVFVCVAAVWLVVTYQMFLSDSGESDTDSGQFLPRPRRGGPAVDEGHHMGNDSGVPRADHGIVLQDGPAKHKKQQVHVAAPEKPHHAAEGARGAPAAAAPAASRRRTRRGRSRGKQPVPGRADQAIPVQEAGADGIRPAEQEKIHEQAAAPAAKRRHGQHADDIAGAVDQGVNKDVDVKKSRKGPEHAVNSEHRPAPPAADDLDPAQVAAPVHAEEQAVVDVEGDPLKKDDDAPAVGDAPAAAIPQVKQRADHEVEMQQDQDLNVDEVVEEQLGVPDVPDVPGAAADASDHTQIEWVKLPPHDAVSPAPRLRLVQEMPERAHSDKYKMNGFNLEASDSTPTDRVPPDVRHSEYVVSAYLCLLTCVMSGASARCIQKHL